MPPDFWTYTRALLPITIRDRMEGASFTVWQELKAYAKTYADSDRHLPVDGECEHWLQQIIQQNVDQVRLRDDVFAFYAAELCAMITDYRRERLAS